MLKIRASQLYRIMTGTIGLTDKQEKKLKGYCDRKKPLTDRMKEDVKYLEYKRDNPELSQTTKDYLIELYTEKKYNRTKDVYSKYMEKGTKQELEAITLLNDFTGKLYFKNEEHYEHDFFTGTPDIVSKRGKYLRDIKCSWDVFTFEKVKFDAINGNYYWQLQAYMDLLEYDKAYLDYCLVDTPGMLIDREQRRLDYDEEISNLEDSVRAMKEIEQNLTFGDIPIEDRVYTIEVKRNDKDIEEAKWRIALCREWWKENLKG